VVSEKQGEKRRRLYLDEYRKQLLERVEKETRKEDIINEFNVRNGQGLTSPTTPSTTEETRLLMEYIDRANMFNLSERDEKRGKILKLRKFFKSKRNQQVEVYAKCGTESLYKVGKVSTIGRDFVMLTTLKERMWIPYSAIESANIPYGIPNYSNTHQHFLYDNNLRNKLVFQFGETVAKRDLLKQQFFEESIQTNLEAWKGTWVVVFLDTNQKKVGKILSCKEGKLVLTFFGEYYHMNVKDLKYIETIRILTIFTHFIKRFK
jgi:ribosome maturation factor RimP